MSVSVCVFMSVSVCVRVSVCLSVYLSVSLSVSLSDCLIIVSVQMIHCCIDVPVADTFPVGIKTK